MYQSNITLFWCAVTDALAEFVPVILGGFLLTAAGASMILKITVMRHYGGRSFARRQALRACRRVAATREISTHRRSYRPTPAPRYSALAIPRTRSLRGTERRWQRRIFVIAGTLAMSSGFARETESYKDLHIPPNREILATLHPGISSRTLRISPDGQRIAYMATLKEGGEVVCVNDVQSPKYDGIVNDSLSFSPDSKRVAWGALHNGKKVVVVDGQEFPAFDGSAEGMPVWSADSKHFAYFAASESGKLLAVVDGKAGKPWDSVIKESFVFSPDGSRFAFVAKDGDSGRVVVDGDAGPSFKNIAGFTFSPDGSHFAYIAMSEQSMTVIFDGVETVKARAFIKDTLRFEGMEKLQVIQLDGNQLLLVQTNLPALTDSKASSTP